MLEPASGKGGKHHGRHDMRGTAAHNLGRICFQQVQSRPKNHVRQRPAARPKQASVAGTDNYRLEFRRLGPTRGELDECRPRAPPPLQIWAPDLHRLQRLADSAENAGHPAAYFLLSELNRANPYDGSEPPAFAVSVNSWVTFSIDDSSTVQRRLLVLPEDCVDAEQPFVGAVTNRSRPCRTASGLAHALCRF